MEKQEKLLRKIDKLLARYGVEDEEARKNFLEDLSKYNGEEEEKVDEETSQETEKVEDEKVETEEVKTETEEKVEEEKPIEEEAQETETEIKEEETQEQPKEEVEAEQVEEKQEEAATETEKVVDDFSSKFEEYSKTLEALSSRIASMEDIVAKLGVPESPVGLEPNAQAKVQGENDAFDYFVHKRIG